jgi:hypothetical protein
MKCERGYQSNRKTDRYRLRRLLGNGRVVASPSLSNTEPKNLIFPLTVIGVFVTIITLLARAMVF